MPARTGTPSVHTPTGEANGHFHLTYSSYGCTACSQTASSSSHISRHPFMNSNRIQTVLWTAALVTATATPAHAQLDMVKGLFEEVNAVTIFVQRGSVADAGKVTGDDLDGAGLEVLIDLVSGGNVNLELGLGASYLRGYGSSDTLLDLRTSVRALPTISLYASRDIGQFSGYLGASFGLVDLWNAQAYDRAGRAWNVDAQTFELGGSAGAYWTSPSAIGIFVEGGYRKRSFPSAKWTLPEGATLPEDWRSLDLSGYYAQAGIQLRVEGSDRNDAITPPAPAGVWSLEKVDGAAPPGVLDSTRDGKRELVHAVLRLVPGRETNSYQLDMNVRTTAAAGVAIESLPTETGSYTKSERADARQHILTFTGGRARSAERLAGRLYVTWEGHVLTFAPGNAAPASK